MNERIKEIIIETLGKEGVVDSRAFGHWAMSDEQMEKFAELIVQECKENFSKVWYEQGLDIRGAEIGKFLARFDEHFGVEE